MRTPGASTEPSQLGLFDDGPLREGGRALTPDRDGLRPGRSAPPSRPPAMTAPGVSSTLPLPTQAVSTEERRDPEARSHSAVDAQPAPPAGAGRPTLLRHPEAQREVALGGHAVAYALRRARRRSIGFVVSPEGLAVAAPRWATIAQIETALRDKATWILRKLAEQHERARRLAAARVEWRDGAVIPFLGAPLVLRLDPACHGLALEAAVGADGARALRIGLPAGAQPAQLRDAVQGWLQRQARRVFEERCAHYAPQLGVRITRLSLSSAQTRWGSASSNGSVRLNWRLVHLALPLIDYVVVHELAHLRHMDHSPQFWDVVRSAVPDYETQRGRLRDDVLPVWD